MDRKTPTKGSAGSTAPPTTSVPTTTVATASAARVVGGGVANPQQQQQPPPVHNIQIHAPGGGNVNVPQVPNVAPRSWKPVNPFIGSVADMLKNGQVSVITGTRTKVRVTGGTDEELQIAAQPMKAMVCMASIGEYTTAAKALDADKTKEVYSNGQLVAVRAYPPGGRAERSVLMGDIVFEIEVKPEDAVRSSVEVPGAMAGNVKVRSSFNGETVAAAYGAVPKGVATTDVDLTTDLDIEKDTAVTINVHGVHKTINTGSHTFHKSDLIGVRPPSLMFDMQVKKLTTRFDYGNMRPAERFGYELYPIDKLGFLINWEHLMFWHAGWLSCGVNPASETDAEINPFTRIQPYSAGAQAPPVFDTSSDAERDGLVEVKTYMDHLNASSVPANQQPEHRWKTVKARVEFLRNVFIKRHSESYDIGTMLSPGYLVHILITALQETCVARWEQKGDMVWKGWLIYLQRLVKGRKSLMTLVQEQWHELLDSETSEPLVSILRVVNAHAPNAVKPVSWYMHMNQGNALNNLLMGLIVTDQNESRQRHIFAEAWGTAPPGHRFDIRLK